MKITPDAIIRKVWRKWAQQQLLKRGYLHFLRHRPSDAIPPDFADLWSLYQTVRHRKPEYILEFGSGCSTVILAQALYDNQSGYLYSIDSDHHWAEVTSNSMPTHLKRFCEVSHSPVVGIGNTDNLMLRHSRLPDVIPNFLYLDGPPLMEGVVSVDPLDMEERLPEHFYMVVDGRLENSRFLRRHLKRKYIYRYTWPFGNSIFELDRSE